MQFIEEIFKGTSDYIEIREIGKTKNDTRQHFLDKQSIKTYIPPEDKNIYFGVFGRNSRSGKAIACNDTRVVWCDYDNFNSNNNSIDARAEEVRQNISKAKMPKPSVMVSSGNGIHAYWLLSERESKGIVEVNKAIASSTNGDLSSCDKARILRLPNTRNVKDIKKPLKCKVIDANYNRLHDLKDITSLLGVSIGAAKQMPMQADKGLTSTLLDSISSDRPCISEILKGVPKGERNWALGRLTKWLQLEGYTKIRAKGIIIAWNKRNKPSEDKAKLVNTFEWYWKGDYKLLGCSLKDKALQQRLSKYCDRYNCKFSMAISNIQLDNSIPYNNRLLNELYKISGNDLIVYGLLVRHKEGLTTSELIGKLTSRALGKPCISKPTRIKAIDTLKAKGFIEVAEGVPSNGIENLYKAIPQGTYGIGYTLLSNGAINGAIDKRVTSGELKLYVLLMKYAFGKGSCYPSLNTLAKDLRTSKNYISKTLCSLEKNDYIKREIAYFKGAESLDIRLLI